MEKKKVRVLTLWIVGALAVCTCIFFVVRKTTIDKSLMCGNVAMAEMFTNNASEEMKTFENQVFTNKGFRENTMFCLTYIDSRTSELLTNTKLAIDALEDHEGYDDLVKNLEDVKKIASETVSKTSTAVEAYNLIVNGNKNVNYEKYSNEALVSLLLLGACNSTGSDFIEAADRIIESEGLDENMALAFARDQWVIYLAMEKYLEENEDDDTVSLKLNSAQTRAEFKSCTASLRKSILSATAMNDFLTGSRYGLSDRLQSIYENDTNVGRHTICASEVQIDNINLNRTGWTVFVMDKGTISKVCILTDDNIIKKTPRNESNLALAVDNASSYTISQKYSREGLYSSIAI